MKSVPLRQVAAKVLAHTLHGNFSLEDSIDQEFSKHKQGSDVWNNRAWIFEVTSQALRFFGRIDWILNIHCTKKPPTGNVRRLLDIAIAQLISQDTASALVVSETVQAISEKEGQGPAKFANAVLRKVAEERDQWKTWEFPEKESAETKAAWASMPVWLWKLLLAERGVDWLKNFALTAMERPLVWYRTIEGETMQLANGVEGTEPPGFVQDLGNQKLLQWAIPQLDATKPILDLCSAPGGKSVALALAKFQVVATDISANRLLKVEENRNRLGLQESIGLRAWADVFDSTQKWKTIWLDAPCSSTGIIRRHPEIKWNRESDDIQKQAEGQRKILEWAKAHLMPGGQIVYSLCSVLRLEKDAYKKVEGLVPVATWESDSVEMDGVFATILKV